MSLRKIAAALAVVGMMSVASASAATILTFGQVSNANQVTGTNNGAGSTTISGTNIEVTITQILAGIATPVNAFLTFSATNTNAAVSVAGNVAQNFAGQFSITNGATNYLSGTFTDAVFGSGASLVLSAAQPPDTVTFTSNVIANNLLATPRGISLSFANVTPLVSIFNGSLASFTSSVSGTFSADTEPVINVPEPASLLLLGSGLVGVAARARRRRTA